MSAESRTPSVPLNLRLRTEAKEWDEDEAVRQLVLEAAIAIEHLAAELVEVRMTVASLPKLLSEHHAAGALDGVLPGERCPVCKASETGTGWAAREARSVRAEIATWPIWMHPRDPADPCSDPPTDTCADPLCSAHGESDHNLIPEGEEVW